MASRKDSKGRKLNTGESQRTDGIYVYRYINAQTGNREAVYSKDLKELRRKEKEVNADIYGLFAISNFSSSVIIWHLLNKKWYSKWYSRVSAKVEVLFFYA